MPTFRDLTLPEVEIKGDPAALDALIHKEALSPETMLELALYLGRQKSYAVDTLDGTIKLLREKIMVAFAKQAKEHRETLRSPAGTCSYTDAGRKITSIDRDAIYDNLTPEQVRATYLPDLKALATLLRPAEFNRYVTTERTEPRITIKDSGGTFDEF